MNIVVLHRLDRDLRHGCPERFLALCDFLLVVFFQEFIQKFPVILSADNIAALLIRKRGVIFGKRFQQCRFIQIIAVTRHFKIQFRTVLAGQEIGNQFFGSGNLQLAIFRQSIVIILKFLFQLFAGNSDCIRQKQQRFPVELSKSALEQKLFHFHFCRIHSDISVIFYNRRRRFSLIRLFQNSFILFKFRVDLRHLTVFHNHKIDKIKRNQYSQSKDNDQRNISHRNFHGSVFSILISL